VVKVDLITAKQRLATILFRIKGYESDCEEDGPNYKEEKEISEMMIVMIKVIWMKMKMFIITRRRKWRKFMKA
jgi:hypothetical protein